MSLAMVFGIGVLVGCGMMSFFLAYMLCLMMGEDE